MKILLIYPYFLEDRVHKEEIAVLPIGVYYVAALLKENHYDVELLNWHAIDKAPEKIEKTLLAKQADIIGFSIVHANRWGAIDIARIAKRLEPKVKTVFGGPGATFLWEHLLTHFPQIDFVVIGEGEYTFLNLVRNIQEQRYDDLARIKGIAYVRKGKIIRNDNADSIKNLDDLPVPAKYFTYQHVSSSRGCPGNCNFCGSPLFWGHKVRFHSAAYFVRQLEILYEKGITFFYFSDDTLTLIKDRIITICKKILERGLRITWVAISRVDHVSDDILYWMRKAGCTQISYGVESGSEKTRKLLGKPIPTGRIKKAFALTQRYGMLARAYFIYGCPGETWETIQESIDLIAQIRPLSIIFYILDIFPGTAFYNDYKKRHRVTDDIWLDRVEDIMYWETDPNLSREMVLAFGDRLRTAYYGMLPSFAESLELIDNQEFAEMHADFLSRLGMTFSHGDYSYIDALKDKEEVAEKLFRRALDYHPDHRAYLGLGIVKQKNGDYRGSIEILAEGAEKFPHSEPIGTCLGVSYMNLGAYREALNVFMKFGHSKEARQYMAQCYRALGEMEKASEILTSLRSRDNP